MKILLCKIITRAKTGIRKISTQSDDTRLHDSGDINANCAVKLCDIPLVLLLVIWPVDEGLVEIVDAHCDGSLSADYSGGYHGVCRDLCGCGALFTFIST